MKRAYLLLTFLIALSALPAYATQELPLGVIKFRTASCLESDGFEAFSLMLPSDWQFTSDINELMFNSMTSSSISFQAIDNKSSKSFELLPGRVFKYSDDPGVESEENIPPVSACAYLEDFLLPEYRPDADIIETINLPELAELVQENTSGIKIPDGSYQSFDAALVVVEYTDNGEYKKEEIFVIINRIDTPIQTVSGVITNTTWVADFQFAFKAPAIEFENSRGLFESMLNSIRINPDNKRFTESSQNRQAVYTLILHEFSMYTNHTDEYVDPILRSVIRFPTGYSYGWLNLNGEFILTTTPYDPNLESDIKWLPMEKR